MTQMGETATLQEHQQALYRLLAEFHRVCAALEIPYYLFSGTLLGSVRHADFIPWDDDLDVILLRKDYNRLLQEAPPLLGQDFFLQREGDPHWPMFFSKLRLNGTACIEKYHPKDLKTHRGVYMDIFPCDHAYESLLGRKLQFYASKVVIAKGLDRRGYDTGSRKKKLFMGLCRLLPKAPFQRLVEGPKTPGSYLHGFLAAASKFQKSVYPAACFGKPGEGKFRDGLYPIPADPHSLLTVLYGDYMTPPPEEERKCKAHCVLVDLRRSYEEYENYEITFDVPIKSIR